MRVIFALCILSSEGHEGDEDVGSVWCYKDGFSFRFLPENKEMFMFFYRNDSLFRAIVFE